MEANRVKVLGNHLTAVSEVSAQAVGNMAGSPLTTHILDTAKGGAAVGVPITVYSQAGDGWTQLAQGSTNADGRCPGLLTQAQFTAGVYKITFQTSVYFKQNNIKGFYPYVDVVFEIEDPSQHYHVPLLLSPFGYSTYRGT